VTFLLDVNVLIALVDASHRDHVAAHHWFARLADAHWATCPIVENGMIRIVGHPRYPMPDVAGFPAKAAELLLRLRQMRGHVFWSDDLSLVAEPFIDLSAVAKSDDVTDTYLLALAVRNRRCLATFDQRLRTDAIKGGPEALLIIPTA
jgi:toxin-antitoxin system PIN domain toxin